MPPNEMNKLCGMASSSIYLYGLHSEQAVYRPSKEFQTFLQSSGTRKESVRPVSVHVRSLLLEDPRKPAGLLLDSNRIVKVDSTIKNPVLGDVQGTHLGSTLVSSDVKEQMMRYINILKFVFPGRKEEGKLEADSSLLSEFTKIQKLGSPMKQEPACMDGGFCFYEFGDDESKSSLFFLENELSPQKAMLDVMGSLACNPKIMVHSDGRVLFSGTRDEMEDILSIVVEFYLTRNLNKWRSPLMLVPQLSRVATIPSDAQTYVQDSSLNIEAAIASPLKIEAAIVAPLKTETATFAPLKSLKKMKAKKPLREKKSNRKSANQFNQRDLYETTYFHACESLLSLILERRGKTCILDIKKSGPKLPELLTQCTAKIAGTGLAVLLSVICKVAGGRVPFCASKIFNTGLGLGLVWLSWTVNKLRDSVVYVSNKNTRKTGVKDEKEMLRRLDRSVYDIYFSAATLMTITVLRFA